MVYYDNIDGQVKWNKVEGAKNYAWTYAGSEDGWKTIETNYIPAEEVSKAIENSTDSVRFAIRALNANSKSQTEYLGLDLTAFYGARATLKDISKIDTTLKDPTATLKGGYSYTQNYAENTFVENAFVFNDNSQTNGRIKVALHATGWMKFDVYLVSIYSNGNITIGINESQLGVPNGRYWQRPNAVAFELGKKYIATYGVEPLFNKQGNKVADRVSVRISEEDAERNRKLLTIISYDNYEYAWDGVSVNYSSWINITMSNITDCQVSCASLVRDITYVTPDGVSHGNPATYTVNGETVAFAKPTAVPT
jgi:hypothetical protein